VELGTVRCDDAVFQTLRIEAGMPLYGVDFDDRNLPQEVGRDAEAINFTKGCYLGQETVARIDALGHVNQQISGVRFQGSEPPQMGAMLTHAGRPVGIVTSAAYSPRLAAPLALAMLRREHTAVGSRLDSPIGQCEVVALPV
jgi:folate-binding protein YgfZ